MLNYCNAGIELPFLLGNNKGGRKEVSTNFTSSFASAFQGGAVWAPEFEVSISGPSFPPHTFTLTPVGTHTSLITWL